MFDASNGLTKLEFNVSRHFEDVAHMCFKEYASSSTSQYFQAEKGLLVEDVFPNWNHFERLSVSSYAGDVLLNAPNTASNFSQLVTLIGDVKQKNSAPTLRRCVGGSFWGTKTNFYCFVLLLLFYFQRYGGARA